jgi:hypothetical protein
MIQIEAGRDRSNQQFVHGPVRIHAVAIPEGLAVPLWVNSPRPWPAFAGLVAGHNTHMIREL